MTKWDLSNKLKASFTFNNQQVKEEKKYDYLKDHMERSMSKLYTHSQ